MHAYIIVGGNENTRMEEITKRTEGLVSAWDTATLAPVEGEPYGVDAVHTFLSSLALGAVHAKQKIGIIRSAEALTTEAQNALLKTLEEPPPNTQIFLETGNSVAILPTILSRCTTLTAAGESAPPILATDILQKILSASVGEKISLTSEYSDTSEHARAFIDAAICTAGGLLRETYTSDYARLLHRLYYAKSQLAVHVNPKLVIDHIFLQDSLDKDTEIM